MAYKISGAEDGLEPNNRKNKQSACCTEAAKLNTLKSYAAKLPWRPVAATHALRTKSANLCNPRL
jgi:hypothetical protein